MVAFPAVLAMYCHQTDFPVGFWLTTAAHGGIGSVASVVADELSTVLAKIAVVTGIAFAKLSFTGGAALLTVNKSCCTAAPPPGGKFVTPIKNCPPDCSNVWDSVDVI